MTNKRKVIIWNFYICAIPRATDDARPHALARSSHDGKILNIAGSYIAYGIRHRASGLVTLELGHQSEIELAEKLSREVHAERLTRLDRMLIAEQEKHGFVDLRPGRDSHT
jgi:type IV secretory pathway VirD2 relaxase